MTFSGPAKPNGAAMAVVALVIIAQANQDQEDRDGLPTQRD